MSQSNDFQIWNGYNVNKSLFKNTNFNFEFENRFDENINLRKSTHYHFELSQRLHKSIKISAAYRFARKRDKWKIYESRNRFDINLQLRKKIKRWTISYRSRYQTSYKSIYTSEYGKTPTNYWRHKLGVSVNLKKKLKKLTPGYSIEFINQLHNEGGFTHRALRHKIFADYRIKKRKHLNLFYMIETEKNINRPLRAFILGLGYTYDFKNKKKKKDKNEGANE